MPRGSLLMVGRAGTDSVSARVAEWARDHHLSWAVTWLENETCAPPPTGGGFSAAQRRQLLGPGVRPSPRPSASAAASADVPVNIPAQAATPLPGEGVWRPVTYGPAGDPVIEGIVERDAALGENGDSGGKRNGDISTGTQGMPGPGRGSDASHAASGRS